MKKEEKEVIYNLLKSADSYVNGYVRNQFKNQPLFSDDEEVIEQPLQMQQASEPSTNVEMPESQTSQSSEVASSSGPITDSPATASHGMSISELNAKILRCTRCQLARTRNNVVPGQGVENPLVLVVGEGPGYDEDIQGMPFVGKAGKLLDKMLAAIQLDRNQNCYIANIVKCRPPNNRDPLPEEQAACISFLEAQIHILKPKMILCMGRISGQKLLNTDTPVGQLRGNFHDYNGIPLLVTYHPSALLRNESLKRPAWEDLKLFKRKLDQILATTN